MAQADPIGSLKGSTRNIAHELEKLRQIFMVLLVFGIGLTSFLITFGLLMAGPKGLDLRYIVTFGALVPSTLIYLVLSRIYIAKAIKRFIDRMCAASGFTHHDGCVPIKAADAHKILPAHNQSHMETGLHGSYRGVTVAIQEAILTELKHDPLHKKKEKEYLRFWGLLVRLQLSRRVDGHTVVIPRAAMKTFFGTDFSHYHEVKIPGEGKFEKIYEAVTTDTVEARLLVNPGFRDKFMGAGKALNVYWSEASFQGNEILLAFQRFRPFIRTTPLWKPITEQAVRRHAEELEGIMGIVDALKANPQIGI